MGKENFYRCGQVAKELGTSSYKIRRLAESGLIPDAEFSGSQWHIPVAAVERMKRDGLPPLPKVVDTDDAGTSPTANPKERTPTTLLAEPSPEMITAAERAEISGRELTVAKNRLEHKRVGREETEIDDFYADRKKRQQDEEERQYRLAEEQAVAEQQQRDKKAAAEQRKKFLSTWLEYALQRTPNDAPTEVELDIHDEILKALQNVDTDERDSTVRRLVDAAVDRSLKPWNTEKTKRSAIETALSGLPYKMRWYEPWKRRAAKLASEALADIRPGADRDEMLAIAEAALAPLTLEYSHAQKVENAIHSISIDGANSDERSEAQDLVREALVALPAGSADRQIALAKVGAMQPVVDRVIARLATEERCRRREHVMYGLHWKLPSEISDDDEQDAKEEIEEALNELPAGASEKQMESIRDKIISDYEADYRAKQKAADRKAERAKQKSHLVTVGLQSIPANAQRLLRDYEYDRRENALLIELRVKSEIKKFLEDELTGTEDERDVVHMVREEMEEIEGW
jgi:hypothetical protein